MTSSRARLRALELALRRGRLGWCTCPPLPVRFTLELDNPQDRTPLTTPEGRAIPLPRGVRIKGYPHSFTVIYLTRCPRCGLWCEEQESEFKF